MYYWFLLCDIILAAIEVVQITFEVVALYYEVFVNHIDMYWLLVDYSGIIDMYL